MSPFSDFSAGTEMAGDSGASAAAGQWAVMLVGHQGTPGTKPRAGGAPPPARADFLWPDWWDPVVGSCHLCDTRGLCKVMLVGPDTCPSSLTLIKAEFLSFFFSFPRMNTILPAVIRQVESGWDGSLGG